MVHQSTSSDSDTTSDTDTDTECDVLPTSRAEIFDHCGAVRKELLNKLVVARLQCDGVSEENWDHYWFLQLHVKVHRHQFARWLQSLTRHHLMYSYPDGEVDHVRIYVSNEDHALDIGCLLRHLNTIPCPCVLGQALDD